MRVVILLSQCSGGDSLRIAPIIAYAFIWAHRLPCSDLTIGKKPADMQSFFLYGVGVKFYKNGSGHLAFNGLRQIINPFSYCNHILGNLSKMISCNRVMISPQHN